MNPAVPYCISMGVDANALSTNVNNNVIVNCVSANSNATDINVANHGVNPNGGPIANADADVVTRAANANSYAGDDAYSHAEAVDVNVNVESLC